MSPFVEIMPMGGEVHGANGMVGCVTSTRAAPLYRAVSGVYDGDFPCGARADGSRRHAPHDPA